MCDLFQANPWKPLLCTNCHQNRSGHTNFVIKNVKCDHGTIGASSELPASTSSMHLYEEIMAQYFTINSTDITKLQSTSVIEHLPTSNENNAREENNDEDSFSDEEQVIIKQSPIEFVQNQSMVNTQGIVLMGPDLRTKQTPIKKPKKINLLKKSKSNADECLKKSDTIDHNNPTPSKLRWFKVKKASPSSSLPTESTTESTKPNISSPLLNVQHQPSRIRVLPEINKLTLHEALSIARRQHLLPNRESKSVNNTKQQNRSPANSNGQSNYGSSIASTTSSSTHSSNEYDSNLVVNNSTNRNSTYLTAVSPVEKNFSYATMLDKTIKLTIERIMHDLRKIIDEYKQNLPVARFQTFKSFLYQHQQLKILSNESIYFLLLQIVDEFSHGTIHPIATVDHFLIANHSSLPIVVSTTSTVANENESIEQFIKSLAHQLFDSTSLPIFNDLLTFENISYRYLSNQIFQISNVETDGNNNTNTNNQNQNDNLLMQRIKLLDFFWNKIQSLRQVQINEENERMIFALYFVLKHVSQSDISFI